MRISASAAIWSPALITKRSSTTISVMGISFILPSRLTCKMFWVITLSLSSARLDLISCQIPTVMFSNTGMPKSASLNSPMTTNTAAAPPTTALNKVSRLLRRILVSERDEDVL